MYLHPKPILYKTVLLLTVGLATSVGAETRTFKLDVIDGREAVHYLPNAAVSAVSVLVANSLDEGLPNVLVTLKLAPEGPSGHFGGGSSFEVAVTDAKGVAVFHGLKPNNIVGDMPIEITAKGVDGQYPGVVGAMAITHHNVLGNVGEMLRQASQAEKRGGWSNWSSRKKLLLIGGGGAAVALGLAFGIGGGASAGSGFGVNPGTGTVSGGK